eukprot:3493096-Rhodomonas_salina.1
MVVPSWAGSYAAFHASFCALIASTLDLVWTNYALSTGGCVSGMGTMHALPVVSTGHGYCRCACRTWVGAELEDLVAGYATSVPDSA